MFYKMAAVVFRIVVVVAVAVAVVVVDVSAQSYKYPEYNSCMISSTSGIVSAL